MLLATLTYLPHVRQSSKRPFLVRYNGKSPQKRNAFHFSIRKKWKAFQKEEPFPIAARATTMCADENETTPMQYLGRLIKDI